MNIHKAAFWLLVVGGLNWGLEALGFGIGRYINSNLAMVIYGVVGIAALYEAFTHKDNCRDCVPSKA
jgi:uncharacterized membrane protein YuzA (DUF378 family)